MKGISRPFLIILLLAVVMGVGFAVYYTLASSRLSSANQTIAVQNERVSALERDITAVRAESNALRSALATASENLSALYNRAVSSEAQVKSLQSDLASAKSQVASLQAEVASSKSQVTSLQTELAASKAQVASLQAQLAAANAADITTLQTRVAYLDLENQELKAITSLTRSALISDSIQVSQQLTAPYSVGSFVAEYAGYVLVSGSSTTPDAYITVTDTFPGYPLNETRYPFGGSSGVVVPVLPGTVTVSYRNANPNTQSTATVSVRYFY